MTINFHAGFATACRGMTDFTSLRLLTYTVLTVVSLALYLRQDTPDYNT